MRTENEYKLRKINQEQMDIDDLLQACFGFLHSLESEETNSRNATTAETKLYSLDAVPESVETVTKAEQELYEFARSRGISVGHKFKKEIHFGRIFEILKENEPESAFFGIRLGNSVLLGFKDKSLPPGQTEKTILVENKDL